MVLSHHFIIGQLTVGSQGSCSIILLKTLLIEVFAVWVDVTMIFGRLANMSFVISEDFGGVNILESVFVAGHQGSFELESGGHLTHSKSFDVGK